MNTRTILFALASAFMALPCSALTVSVESMASAPCGESLGVLSAFVQGGTPPFSYGWSTGATGPYIDYLPPGTYSVTVMDAMGEMATGSGTVVSSAAHDLFDTGVPNLVHCAGDDPYALMNLDDPHNGPGPHGVTSPVTLAGNFSDFYNSPATYIGIWMDTPPGSTVLVNWVDGAGCPGSSYVQFSATFVPPTVQITGVEGACNGSNGRISIAVSGTTPDQKFRVNIRTIDGQVPPAQQLEGGSRLIQNNQSYTIPYLAAGAYWIITDPDRVGTIPNGPGQPLNCVDSMYVEVPDLLGQCAFVGGTVYIDHDQDCVQDPNDPSLAYRLIQFQPGSYYAISNPGGTYGSFLPNGSYTMEILGTGTDLLPICPAVQPIPVEVNGVPQTINVADSSLVPLDLTTAIAAGPARPGFVQNVWMRVSNPGGQSSGPITAMLEFDAQLSFVSAVPAPLSVIGNTVTWGLQALNGSDHVDASLELQVPPDVTLIGMPFSHQANASQAITETTVTNNTAAWSGVFTASFDPNAKSVRTSSGASDSLYFINQDDWMDYTVQFQNTGTDTAFTVVVRDVLPPTLDLGTFEQGIGSHPFTVSFKPGHTVEWRFANILLPDSGTNEAGSHGLVTFRIKPVQPLMIGTTITNAASIYFDHNPPVITEPSVLTAESSTGVHATARGQGLWLMPNPTSGSLEVRVPDNSGDALIEVVSVDGRVVLEQRITAPRTLLDVSHLASGLYTLSVHDVNGTTSSKRFVRE
ncbi:MAG: T9SS type A sorting domain-containing protein [Flavobacteriales bacterium]|nr:T9SS type A sorting domain-containing protein [Flavobacteriales bacterium]